MHFPSVILVQMDTAPRLGKSYAEHKDLAPIEALVKFPVKVNIFTSL